MLVSDQTFLALFPRAARLRPIISCCGSAPGDAADVAARLRELISDKTRASAAMPGPGRRISRFQQTKRPTGIIFGFGVLIGVLVGIVIVFQVLSTDVADHLREYATFKAMGYGQALLPRHRRSRRR